MQIDELDMETSLAEALGAACNAIGRKRVALMLWPEKSAESGQKEVSDCLHPDRRSKFSLEQIDLILAEARKVDCHAPMRYFARTLSYRPPTPVTPESERDRLQREFIRATRTMQDLSAQMEKLGVTDNGNVRRLG